MSFTMLKSITLAHTGNYTGTASFNAPAVQPVTGQKLT